MKQAREEKGWTQAYVAELVGKTDRTIMNIENKGQHPSFNLFFKRRPMNAICDTTAKSETLSVKGCKVKITYAPADTDCLDAIQKLLQTTILRTAGHTAA